MATAASTSEYNRYKERINADIRDLLNEYECQPVFFIGSGVSKRFFNAPNWLELLALVAKTIGLDRDAYTYLVQKHKKNAILIGSDLNELCFEHAWKNKEGGLYPKCLFEQDVDRSLFIKHLICDIIKSQTPQLADISDLPFASEIEAMKAAHPHCIITTNYDDFLEKLFEDYEPIIGERVIRYGVSSVGEIYKLHGSVTDPNSIVVTQSDYENYRQKRKYISAKLVTYFTEHPIFIFGYGFGDPNIHELMEDIGEILGEPGGRIEHIFYVIWNEDAEKLNSAQEEYVIKTANGEYRVRAIVFSDLHWIFEAIAQERELTNINTKLLRALAARTYKLIRSDIPKRRVEVDYRTLEGFIEKQDDMLKIIGITEASNTNLSHPFILTQVGQRLGHKGWHGARKLVERVHKEKGKNIMSTDNVYHCGVKTGRIAITHKWSEKAVEILRKVQNGEPYDICL